MLLFFRSVALTVTKQILLDIELAEFFELKHFQSEEQENENIETDLEFSKLLMSGEISEEMVGSCSHGGKYILYDNFNLMFCKG